MVPDRRVRIQDISPRQASPDPIFYIESWYMPTFLRHTADQYPWILWNHKFETICCIWNRTGKSRSEVYIQSWCEPTHLRRTTERRSLEANEIGLCTGINWQIWVQKIYLSEPTRFGKQQTVNPMEPMGFKYKTDLDWLVWICVVLNKLEVDNC